ncbi:MAG TPA: protein kinase, partial [Gemmatimonadales bacterium]|nr:protein kinase [Gemmatimonadales bacterium]
MAQNRGKSRHSGALPAPAVASGNPFEDIPITSPEAPERLAAALADRYRIERELGQGGMATVYLAHDLRHDRKVALKVLKPELAAVLGAERFVAEIRTTAALQHPHILPLFDSGTADGFLYYVMPFIDGETLRSRLDRERQLGIDEAVRLTSDIADALDYAHRHGVIHRDIKPENILLHDGRPVVADFGIALAVSAAAGGRMTETGLSLGTPHYMSPEQATADREITARSDIYSLGSVLYEMLTGDPPHTGASAQQIIMKIVTEEAQPVTQLRKAVSPNVAAALAKALEKLPADRFESARAFAAALNDPHFTTARAAGLAVPSTRAPSRRAFAALAIVAFLASALAIWGWSRPTARPGRGEVVRQQLTFSGMALAPAISPDGRLVAYVQRSCEHAMVGLCRYSLVVQEVGGSQTSVLIADALRLGTPRWTHDGETVIVSGSLDAERTGLFAVNRLSGTARLIGPSGPFDTHPSADSVLVIPPRPSDVGMALVIGLASGTVADSFPLGGSDGSGIRDVAWSPDARHIGTVERNRITVVDREGRRAGLLDGTFRQSLRWTPDGRGLLVFRVGSVREDEFLRIDVDESGRMAAAGELILSRVPTLYVGLFDVARTTGRMALGTGDAISDIWSFELGARPIRGRRLTRGTTWYGEPALGADGRAVYYLRGD